MAADKMTGKARGFAFVTFADSANAEVACRQRQNIKGRPVECKFAVPRDEQLTIKAQAEQPGGGGERVTKIFVGGLEPSCTEPEFKAYWDNWGTVQEAEIKVDPYTKKSRGFGFITFTDSDMVER
jgi:RNA-binding protein Musashi